MKKSFIQCITVIFISLLGLLLFSCQKQLEPTPVPSPKPNPRQPTSLEKVNTKLDSQLNQLVQAAKLGDIETFAEQSNIELVDGAVRVIVESLPGQVDAAVEAASNLGILEASYNNLLQVVVPITSLTTLANEASVRFVRLPQYPVPRAKGEVDVESN